jgi:hypothetical protein
MPPRACNADVRHPGPLAYKQQATDYDGVIIRESAPGCTIDTINRQKHLKVFQVYREAPTQLMEHNRHYLPDGAEFMFYNDHEEMDKSMREASKLLEHCGSVHGAYEAFASIRAIAARSDIWRAAMLWMHGGLYMDHKVVLTQPLTNFINLENDTIFLPKDLQHQTLNMGKCCSGDWPVQSSLLWSLPRHPILEEILRLQVKRVRSHYYGSSPLETTGPVLYTEAL